MVLSADRDFPMLSGDHESQRPRGADRKDQYRRSVDQYRIKCGFIFGFFGLPAMGVQGAALATLISRIIELGWAVTVSHQEGYIRPDWSRLFHSGRPACKRFPECMLPILGASLAWGIGFTSYSAFMGHLGTDATAANSVAAVVRDLVCCLCNGLASGGGILVGNELGAGDLKPENCMVIVCLFWHF